MKTKIKLESYESTVIRVRQSQTLLAFCQKCEQKVLHLSVARAAAALQISETAVFRLTESNEVHSTEIRTGALFICANSISKFKINFMEGE